MGGSPRYYRFALFADARLGKVSFSWRLKECLESLGHTVFWFDQALQPYAFTRPGVVRAYMVRTFLRVQKLDCVLLADGLLFDYPRGARAAADAPVGVVCESSSQARGVLEALSTLDEVGADSGEAASSAGWLPDFAVAVGGNTREVLVDDGRVGAVYEVSPYPDTSFVRLGLANAEARGWGILCLQDATPERVTLLKALRAATGSTVVRCVGKGWPASWTVNVSGGSSLTYAVKRTKLVAMFDGDDEFPDGGVPSETKDHMAGLALASGAQAVALGESCASDLWSAYARHVVDANSFVDEGARVLRGEAEGGFGLDPLGFLASEGLTLDAQIESLLDALKRDFCGYMKGSIAPRSVACVLGYMGKSNYANEHILATIDLRLRTRVEGATVVAISLEPQHTLEMRGVYAISLADKNILDGLLDRASVVLVVAGLLNDQGMRWGMGKAELLSNVVGCDLVAVASISSLTALNDTALLFYGAGAGSLDLGDAKKLVALMGIHGARFAMRDGGSADFVRDAGVPESQIFVKADPVLLAEANQTERVDKWLIDRGIDLKVDRLLAVTLRVGDGLPSDFPQRVARALEAVNDRFPRVRPVLCLMDPGDTRAVDRVKAAMGEASSVLTFDPGENPDALSDLFSRSFAGLSMQYYSALAFVREGVPFVSVSNHPKEGALLLEDLGCSALSLNGSATLEELANALSEVLEQHDSWAARMREQGRSIKERAREAEDMAVDTLRRLGVAKAFGSGRLLYPHDRATSDRARDGAEAQLRERLQEARDERDRAYETAATRRRWRRRS